MSSFIDVKGQEWQLRIPYRISQRLKSPTQEDLDNGFKAVDLLDPKALQEVIDDCYSRFSLIYRIVQPSRTTMGVKPVDPEDSRPVSQRAVDEFDDRLSSAEVYVNANNALKDALEDFFHRAGRRDLARVMSSVTEAAERLESLSVEKVESPRVKKAIDDAIARASEAIDNQIHEALATNQETPGTK